MEKTLKTLEFDKIKEMLLQYNINELSRIMVDNLSFYDNFEIIDEELSKTREGYNLVTLGTFPNLVSLVSHQDNLDIINKNGVLSLEEIYNFATTLEIINEIKSFKNKNKIEDNLIYVSRLIDSLMSLDNLHDNIKYCISPNFTLYDHASTKLKEIRREISRLEKEIKEKLNEFVKKNGSILQDNYITTRDNHYVIPIKAQDKNKIKGIIMDTSSSQNTLFIEPYFVYENNIALKQLYYDEQIEIQRIIKSLCLMISKETDIIIHNENNLKELSFILLKGNFGLGNNYEVATLNIERKIIIKDGYHPLLDVKTKITNDYYLGNDNKNIIVITGPNAGGKTVCLKTVGIISIMNQCGLPVPVSSATLPVFKHIYVDIGDEQSIIASLSGFSSSMKNIVNIINNVDDKSLVILDELASKTDPQEGEALAKAIIEYLNNQGCLGLISTHFLGIKNFASENDKIILASMGFNKDNLAPTYKLLLNTVGRSYALEISKKLGLKENIINNAYKYEDNKKRNLDIIIDELSNNLSIQNKKLEMINEKEKELDDKLNEINKEKEKIIKEYDKQLKEINENKEKMLDDARNEINQIVSDFKMQISQDGIKHHLKNKAFDDLDKLDNKNKITNDNQNEDYNFKIGDNVKIKNVGTVGKIIDINQDTAYVETKNNKFKINIHELELYKNVENKNKKQIKVQQVNALRNSVPLSLNLIGMHVDEALLALKNYQDAAILCNYKQVTIIHGFGTGTLRKAVHEFLSKSKYVDSFRLGGYNEGMAGATVVTFK